MRQIRSIMGVLSVYLRSFVDTMSDRSLMNRSLFSSNLNVYRALKWFNIVFSFLLFIPVFASLASFNLPHLLGYLIMAFLGYATWIFQGITGVPIFEEIRFLVLLHLISPQCVRYVAGILQQICYIRRLYYTFTVVSWVQLLSFPSFWDHL